MILKQYYLGCLAHASYLIADEKAGIAAVVDPQRDIDQYLADAEEHGLQIRHVFLTHFHADFLAGHLELRDRTDACIHLGARAQAEYSFAPAREGDSIELGQVRLEVLETPGHTPEGISLVVYDGASDAARPHAVLTGDTLFIGDVGRPDLMASVGVSAEELAGMLYDSLHRKLLKLPDPTLVYPAHGAGSMCGKNLSTDTVSTIEAQRLHNYALQAMSKEEFIRLVTAGQTEAPAYFSYDATLNRQERETLDQSMKRSLKGLPLEEVLRLRNQGAQVLDVRDAAHFAGAHLAGSTNVGLDGKFATWAGTVLDRERPIVVLAEPGREEEALLRLGRIGFDHVAGFLEGGMLALEQSPDLVHRTERITASTLAQQLQSAEPPVVLDVRSDGEREGGAIEGSLHIPLNHLRERVDEVPREGTLVVHCAGGYRSSIAASILEQEGITEVQDLVGGIAAWKGVS
jgi:glyoxylase-like metal-dependent hydrolase (beta-lactamase superfamily II)/rhodanese-related sulfurtransferase